MKKIHVLMADAAVLTGGNRHNTDVLVVFSNNELYQELKEDKEMREGDAHERELDERELAMVAQGSTSYEPNNES